MAGFRQGGVEFKKKTVIGDPSTADHVIVYWNDLNDLIIKSSSGEDVIATESLLASISGNLQDQIDTIANDTSRLKWVDLVNTWTAEPTEAAYSGGDGQVFEYTYGTTTLYRFVPTVYDTASDQFFVTYSNPNLSGLVATRGVNIS
jgi:hypothetical protein